MVTRAFDFFYHVLDCQAKLLGNSRSVVCTLNLISMFL